MDRVRLRSASHRRGPGVGGRRPACGRMRSCPRSPKKPPPMHHPLNNSSSRETGQLTTDFDTVGQSQARAFDGTSLALRKLISALGLTLGDHFDRKSAPSNEPYLTPRSHGTQRVGSSRVRRLADFLSCRPERSGVCENRRSSPPHSTDLAATMCTGHNGGKSGFRKSIRSSFHLAQRNNGASGTKQLVERHPREGVLCIGVDLVELAMQRAEPCVRRQAKRAVTYPLQRRDSIHNVEDGDFFRRPAIEYPPPGPGCERTRPPRARS